MKTKTKCWLPYLLPILRLCHFCKLFDDLFSITDAESKPILFSHDPIQICFDKMEFSNYLYRQQLTNKNISLNKSDIISSINIEKYLCVYESIININLIKASILPQLSLEYIEYLLNLDSEHLKFDFTVKNQWIIVAMISTEKDISTLPEIIFKRLGHAVVLHITLTINPELKVTLIE